MIEPKRYGRGAWITIVLLACVLLCVSLSEDGAARAQTPAPLATPVAPAQTAAPPTMTPEETILVLKEAINQKDMQIAQLVAQTASCRGELLKIERTSFEQAKNRAEPKPATTSDPPKPIASKK